MTLLNHSHFKALIGQESSLHRMEISSESLSQFCKATKIRESALVPPTYYTLFRAGEFELFEKLEVDLSSILHAEQEFTYERTLHAGDRVQFKTQLSQALEKKTPQGVLHFLFLETKVSLERESHSIPCGTSKTTIVFKELMLN